MNGLAVLGSLKHEKNKSGTPSEYPPHSTAMASLGRGLKHQGLVLAPGNAPLWSGEDEQVASLFAPEATKEVRKLLSACLPSYQNCRVHSAHGSD